ncbi:S-adenosyl-L-methionine-dependent methyltransferase [Cercophora newfieldiana]|uniref:S-adenosyl-L-methionine-dependent methyltransferase n=1 Tax=Cercophora newfieldiana TaxID=92897 RepID=A0AA40CJE1_9PEZI|nr:S-adenosyl-L-methionine-dependent methyltransferase [Cercophora newfieldiana]
MASQEDAAAEPLHTGSSLTSIRSSILQHQFENGRTYHSFSAGKYAYPNDEREAERLDMQHYIFLLTLRGEIALSPKASGAKRVLDIGTGTGAWAIDYADAHPEAEVIGVDLSPIQPAWVPPNLQFEIDDVEQDWTWTKSFDYIFSRAMAGSFTDPGAVVEKAFHALEPGGVLEMQDFICRYWCDDGTLTAESPISKLSDACFEAAENMGRPLDLAPTYKGLLEKAGFVDVVEKRFKWPLNPWPKDPYYKELGKWTLAMMDGGLEGLSLALLTRGLGWSPEKALMAVAEARPLMKDRNIHAYLPIFVVYGRKPE